MTRLARVLQYAVLMVTLPSVTYADSIGLTEPLLLPAITSNSRILYFDGTATTLNITGNPLNYTDISTFGGTAFAAVETSALGPSYGNFRGSIHTDVSGASLDSFVQAGSFVRDQILFAAVSGQPATLAFNFALDYELTTTQPEGWGAFYAAWDNTWATAADPAIPHTIFSEQNIVALEGAHATSFTLRTNDFDPTLLLTSGTYLPFSLGIHGRAFNASLDWPATITLTSVSAFDANGVQLTPDQFSVVFGVNGAAPAAVPEPGTLVLLAGGLLARAWRSRRPVRKDAADLTRCS